MLMIFLSSFVVGLSGAMMPGPLLTYTIQKTFAKGWRAGFIIIAGHAVLELCLIAVIFLGFDLVLQSNVAQIAIGLVGGVLLGYMGIDMIYGVLRNRISVNALTNSGELDNTEHGIMEQHRAVYRNVAYQVVGEYDLVNQTIADDRVLIQSEAEQASAASASMGTANTGVGGMILSGIVISAANPYFLMWWAIVGLGFIIQSYDAYGFAGAAVFYAGHISVDVLWYGLISILIGTTRRFIKEKYYRIVIVILGCALVFFGLKFAYGAIAALIKLL
jgi:threonine/homoserine/homoserine lactone efflux protein